MEHQTVSSTNLASVGYDRKSETLEVHFQNGSVFQYHDVPPETHEQLMQAKSVGGFFHRSIKNDFEHSKQS